MLIVVVSVILLYVFVCLPMAVCACMCCVHIGNFYVVSLTFTGFYELTVSAAFFLLFLQLRVVSLGASDHPLWWEG